MRAASQHAYGSPDVLHFDEIPRPRADDAQIVVEVHASVVSQGDRRLRAADFPGFTAIFGRLYTGLRKPRHPTGGTMFAGRVVEVGPGVTRFAVGDDVFGSVTHGAYAEYLRLPQDAAVARMPNGFDYGQAAALPFGAVTAVGFLRDIAKLAPGERVLIVGASGGVGLLAVQVGLALGAHVTGVARHHLDEIRALGAEAIDATAEDFTTANQRYDVIFDTVSGDAFRRSRRVLTERGRYVSVYATLGLLLQMVWTSFRSGQRAAAGVIMGNAKLMEEVRELAEDGKLRAVIAKRFSFDQIADAHRHLETPRLFGSVVVDVARSPSNAPSPSPSPRSRPTQATRRERLQPAPSY